MGNVISAMPSVIPRRYRRIAARSVCTAEKKAGVTCPTSVATLSTGTLARVQPTL